MPSKNKSKPSLSLRAYYIVSDAVESGVMFGLNRAHKHTDNPSREVLMDNICREVMNALAEVVDFCAC